jgi:hypothetical protein
MYYHPIFPGVNVARSVCAWLLCSLLPTLAAVAAETALLAGRRDRAIVASELSTLHAEPDQ